MLSAGLNFLPLVLQRAVLLVDRALELCQNLHDLAVSWWYNLSSEHPTETGFTIDEL